MFLSATALQADLHKEPPLITKREVEILTMLIKGYNSRQIAEELVISYYTARTHRKNILEKFGKKNTAELVGYALKWVDLKLITEFKAKPLKDKRLLSWVRATFSIAVCQSQ